MSEKSISDIISFSDKDGNKIRQEIHRSEENRNTITIQTITYKTRIENITIFTEYPNEAMTVRKIIRSADGKIIDEKKESGIQYIIENPSKQKGKIHQVYTAIDSNGNEKRTDYNITDDIRHTTHIEKKADGSLSQTYSVEHNGENYELKDNTLETGNTVIPLNRKKELLDNDGRLKEEYKGILVNGRFQGFHLGHYVGNILKAVEMTRPGQKIYIGISKPFKGSDSGVKSEGSPSNRDDESANPFTFQERVDMIIGALADDPNFDESRFGDLVFIPLPLNDKDEMDSVKSAFFEDTEKVVAITQGIPADFWEWKKIIELYNEGFTIDDECNRDNPRGKMNVSGTKVRENRDDLESLFSRFKYELIKMGIKEEDIPSIDSIVQSSNIFNNELYNDGINYNFDSKERTSRAALLRSILVKLGFDENRTIPKEDGKENRGALIPFSTLRQFIAKLGPKYKTEDSYSSVKEYVSDGILASEKSKLIGFKHYFERMIEAQKASRCNR